MRLSKRPGSESNVKEIFDKCWELRNSGEDLVIFNQFDELGNYLWHHEVTGPAMHEVLEQVLGAGDSYRGLVVATGSARNDCVRRLSKKTFFRPARLPLSKRSSVRPYYINGFGEHRIEGIGDKHVPWVHNVKNTDMIIGVDDEATISLTRLFNEPAGQLHLAQHGVPEGLIEQLSWLGISCLGNLVAAIKFAKYYELTAHDVVMTVLTDSMEMYQSRLVELTSERGEFNALDAAGTYQRLSAGANH